MDFEEGSYISKLLIKNIRECNKIGVCIGWNKLDIYNDIPADIIGSLYTREGAKRMFRNIFRNPRIKLLIVIDDNILGQNNIGKHGLQYINDIMNGYIADKDYNYKYLLDNLMVYYITSHNVQYAFRDDKIHKLRPHIDTLRILHDIIDAHDANNGEIEQITRDKIIYDIPLSCKITHIPNEYVGHTIYGSSLFDAWYMTLKHVYKYGMTNANELHEYHSIHWLFPAKNKRELDKELDHYRSIITQPDIQRLIGLDNGIIKDYVKLITENIAINTSSYTYGNRLEPFKLNILNNLLKNINSRHAYATTIKYDTKDEQPPCLVYIQYLFDQYNGALNLYAIFRSHDILRGALANAYALTNLLLNTATTIKCPAGRVEITSISAHIYKDCVESTDLFLKCMDDRMTNIIRYDPRGNCVITKCDNGEYIFELYSHDIVNSLITRINGTPRYIYSKILKDGIIINIEHLEYIFEQLFS